MEKSPVLCCITAQEHCSEILIKGKEFADMIGHPTVAVTVQPTEADAKKRSADMICLDRLSKISGVEIDVVYSDNPLLALAEYIEKDPPIHIFTGKQAEKGSFVISLARLCELPVSTVFGDSVITVN